MNKIISTIIILFIFFPVFGQNIDSLGMDNNPKLNLAETQYLNKNMQTTRQEFDFNKKKILFAKGNNAKTILTKKEYFNEIKPWVTKNETVANFVVVFTDKEKSEINNYDAIVIMWSKTSLTEKRKQEIIAKIKNGL